MQIDLGQLIIWIITGALAGYIVGIVLRKQGFGTVGNIVIGLVGAVVGGLLFRLLNIRLTGLPSFTFSLADLIVAIVGALLLVFVVNYLSKR